MIKTFQFPCPCQIKTYSVSQEKLNITLPFFSVDDGEFWEDAKDKPITELTLSIRESDDYGREDILSYLVYKEEDCTTLWIILNDIANNSHWVWAIQNNEEKDSITFLNYCNTLNLSNNQ